VFRAKQCDHALLFFVNKKLKMVNGRKSIMLNGYGGGRDTRRFEMNGVTEIRPLVLYLILFLSKLCLCVF